jgi:tetratricopeptide (TPR) repeat protein
MAFDYAGAGLWAEARDVLWRLIDAQGHNVHPMVMYAQGYLAHQLGQHDETRTFYQRASALPADYCFPVRLEELVILEHAQALFPQDARVAYYLGNLYYDKKRYDKAIENWALSVKSDPGFSIPWRNLGVAYYNVKGHVTKAVICYEKAAQANPQDGRVLYELDQLRRRTGVPAEARLAHLEQQLDLVRERDDLSVTLATLYNQTQQPQKALDYVLSRRFHPWEGGTGSVSDQFVNAHLLLGQEALDRGDGEQALVHFGAALAPYPDSLGERKHLLRPDAHLHYYAGLAKDAMGDRQGAVASFDRVLAACAGLSEGTYYQALALKQLGKEQEAQEKLGTMLRTARQRRDEAVKEGFATSVPQFVFAEHDLETRRRIHHTYLVGLAALGLGRVDEATAAFEAVLAHDPNHFGALQQLRHALAAN